MFQKATAWCAAYVMICSCAATASAASSYSFVFDQTDYSVAPNAQVLIPVYWQEAVGTDETASLDPASMVGMFGQGVRVSWDNPTAPPQPATVTTTADIAFNSVFTSGITQTSVGNSYAQLSETMDLNTLDVSYGNEVSPGVWRQLIGTFLFTAPASASGGEVTHLRAGPYLDPDGNVGAYIVDGIGVNSYDGVTSPAFATVTVTPEPDTFVLATIAIVGALGYVWRRRRDWR